MAARLPLFTIEQTINTYKYLFEPEPKFGMDFFAEDFEAKEIVLLEDSKAGSQGIPLRFSYYAFFLRLKGETKRTINQFNYLIKPQSLQLVNPGSIYSFEEMSDVSKTYVYQLYTHRVPPVYSMFCICSLIFSISLFILITVFKISKSFAFDAIVLVSLFIS